MSGKKVLLVDDSPTSLFRSSVVVRREGHELLTATDGEEAVFVALSERPDLILMDVVMPNMDGLEACRRLREQDETRATPIILVTSRGEEEAMVNGYESGCNEYVLKPVDARELVEKIRDYLG